MAIFLPRFGCNDTRGTVPPGQLRQQRGDAVKQADRLLVSKHTFFPKPQRGGNIGDGKLQQRVLARDAQRKAQVLRRDLAPLRLAQHIPQ